MAGSTSASKAGPSGGKKGGQTAAFSCVATAGKQVPRFWPFVDKSDIRPAEDALAAGSYWAPTNQLNSPV
jgi:hypothetical protein